MLDFMRLAMKEIDGSTTGFAFSSFGLNRVYGLQADTELHNYLTDTSPVCSWFSLLVLVVFLVGYVGIAQIANHRC